MVEQQSPLGPVYAPGPHGHVAAGIGVVLSESQPGSIVQVAAWPGRESTVAGLIRHATSLEVTSEPGDGASSARRAAFGVAPGRFLVVDEEEDLAASLAAAIGHEEGSVTDLSHARTAIRIEGPKAEWVLAKLFAIDFALAAFPTGKGISTTHHEVFTQIQRTGPARFELYVFRSFARSFWKTLGHAAEETGYEVR